MGPAQTAQYPQVTWSDFAGFRDILIHQYQNVRLGSVWDFSQEDLLALKDAVMAPLSNLTPVKMEPEFEADTVAKVWGGNFLPLLQATVGWSQKCWIFSTRVIR